MAARKKKITKNLTLSAVDPLLDSNEDVPVSKLEKAQADQLLAQALLRYKNADFADKKTKIKEISHLSLMAEEYLSSFALIGYSLQDEKVVVFNMPTAKDEAALVDLLRSTFLDIANNRP